MLKILWKRRKIAPDEQFPPLFTIFYYLMLDFCVKTGIRCSLRDKRLFEITEVEITRVDCIYGAGFTDSFLFGYFKLNLNGINVFLQWSFSRELKPMARYAFNSLESELNATGDYCFQCSINHKM